MPPFALVKNLPAPVRKALKSVQYGRKDVPILSMASVDTQAGGGDGRRGFFTVVDLATGWYETQYGSWGGENPFTSNPVDTGKTYELSPDIVAIKGVTGGTTWAWVYFHPSLYPQYVPNEAIMATLGNAPADGELRALYCFNSIKGGSYRREEMVRQKVRQIDVDNLIAKGWLKKTGAGIQITTEGRNVYESAGRPSYFG